MERPLGYRVLRAGLLAAARAANGVVDRVVGPDGARAGSMPVRRVFRRASTLTTPVEVTFEGLHGGLVDRGTTLLDAARVMDVDLPHYCGGNCSCGTCRVRVVNGGANLSPCQSMEAMVLGPEAASGGWRLACQTHVNGPATVRIPRTYR